MARQARSRLSSVREMTCCRRLALRMKHRALKPKPLRTATLNPTGLPPMLTDRRQANLRTRPVPSHRAMSKRVPRRPACSPSHRAMSKRVPRRPACSPSHRAMSKRVPRRPACSPRCAQVHPRPRRQRPRRLSLRRLSGLRLSVLPLHLPTLSLRRLSKLLKKRQRLSVLLLRRWRPRRLSGSCG